MKIAFYTETKLVFKYLNEGVKDSSGQVKKPLKYLILEPSAT